LLATHLFFFVLGLAFDGQLRCHFFYLLLLLLIVI
jgi:hypothetical protein